MNLPVIAGENWNDYLDNDLNRAKIEIDAHSLLWACGWLTGMYMLSFNDEYLNEAAKPIYHGKLKHYFDTVDYLGYGPYSISASIGFAGLTMLFNDHKLKEAAWTSVESALISSAMVYALKVAIGRKRPSENRGVHFFQPFSGWDDSFPSGHANTAFALITPFVYYYNNPLGYFLLIFPVSTAISRIVLEKHWTTDVITGGVMGIVTGYYLSKWHKEISKTNSVSNVSTPMMFSISIPLNN